jgi:hypothetical protein
MTLEEIAAIPTEWCNPNLPENKGRVKQPSRRQRDGWQTDQSAIGTDDGVQGAKWWAKSITKGEGKPSGKGARPCRFVENNRTCPHGVDCYSLWSHPGGIDVGKLAKSASSGESASDGGTVTWAGDKPTHDKA